MVEAIIANTEKGVWTKEALEEMNFDTLKKVFSSITMEVDYSGLSAHSELKDENKVQPMYPVGVNLETKKE